MKGKNLLTLLLCLVLCAAMLPGQAYATDWDSNIDGRVIESGMVGAEAVSVVKYNANGGEDAPLSQLKVNGAPLTLTEKEPVKEGFVFQGWSVEKDSEHVDLHPGDTYTEDRDLTLYAVWTAANARIYFVRYNANGGAKAPAEQRKESGVDLYLSLEEPVRMGFVFRGWESLKNSDHVDYHPGDIYTEDADLTLYAVWDPDPDAGGISLNKHQLTLPIQNEETLIADTGGELTILTWRSSNKTIATVDMFGKVTAKAYGTAIITVSTKDGKYSDSCTVNTLFSDVTETGHYYFAPVYWAADKGITLGYSDGTFGVGRDCQRRELLIFLWRYAGSPTGYGDARTMFNDMGDYDSESAANKAVAWAYKTGIVKGYADGGIHPTDSIIRKDVMIMLYRMAGKPAVSGTLNSSDCRNIDKNSDTYKAILWGYRNGITKGYSTGTYKGRFGIELNCLREQIVTFLYRYNGLG